MCSPDMEVSHLQRQPESHAATFRHRCQPQQLGPPFLSCTIPAHRSAWGLSVAPRQDPQTLGGQLRSLPFQKAYECLSSPELTHETRWPGKVITLKNAGSQVDRSLAPTMLNPVPLVPELFPITHSLLLFCSLPLLLPPPHPFTFASTL